jgi:c-di-GMP-binding flagellar brake protein YcgR
MSLDRRVHPRKILRRMAMIRLASGEVLKVKTQDVSQGGVCVLLPNNLPFGATCEVAFDLPINGKDYRVMAGAKIVHTVMAGLDGFRAGLEFTRLGETEKELLREYVW